ncbi:MAG TPA: farnesyl diphosphate synthase [Planctomycetaceae bacterium]|nr:farnesyl diphosphate synthase [Planctomycetaceae bacterium]
MSAPSGSHDEDLAPFRRLINDRLVDYVAPIDDCPSRLQEAMAYSLLAGGKRLRPVLVLLACEACGGNPVSALPAACALEMVHTYSLIHDDLPAMDDDDLRRGRPTNHVVYGEALAILAGDALLTLAFEVMARDIQPPALAAACCLDLASASGRCGMVGGQVVDIEAEHQPVRDLAELEGIHGRKTGRLLCSALTLGGRIAGASTDQMADLEIYGKCVGLAFQITDDLLDVSSTPEKMGKQVRKDATLGKLTYPALLGVEESERRADALVEEACRRARLFGERGRRLQSLAEFIRGRDH